MGNKARLVFNSVFSAVPLFAIATCIAFLLCPTWAGNRVSLEGILQSRVSVSAQLFARQCLRSDVPKEGLIRMVSWAKEMDRGEYNFWSGCSKTGNKQPHMLACFLCCVCAVCVRVFCFGFLLALIEWTACSADYDCAVAPPFLLLSVLGLECFASGA